MPDPVWLRLTSDLGNGVLVGLAVYVAVQYVKERRARRGRRRPWYAHRPVVQPSHVRRLRPPYDQDRPYHAGEAWEPPLPATEVERLLAEADEVVRGGAA